MRTTTLPPARAVDDHAGDQTLIHAATVFALAVILHNLDHLRRGVDSISSDVIVAGSFSLLVEVGVVVLAYLRHRLAPLAAAVAGYALAVGYIAVHFLPQRSWLSDSFTSASHVSPLSWLAASLEVAGALTLGTAGLSTFVRRGGFDDLDRPNPEQREIAAVLRHPFVAVYVGVNAAIFAGVLIQLAT